jgi:hypothetical protein
MRGKDRGVRRCVECSDIISCQTMYNLHDQIRPELSPSPPILSYPPFPLPLIRPRPKSHLPFPSSLPSPLTQASPANTQITLNPSPLIPLSPSAQQATSKNGSKGIIKQPSRPFVPPTQSESRPKSNPIQSPNPIKTCTLPRGKSQICPVPQKMQASSEG